MANGEPLDYRIRLVTTIPNYGGRRWWFICPLSRDDGGSPRRVSKLYLPPGERYFGSREGYALTYEFLPGEWKIQQALCVYPCAIWATLSRIRPRFIGVLSRELERRNRAREYLTDAEVQKLTRRESQ